MLADLNGARPRQADLRRAVSTAYYALFHCLARCCADLMIGGSGAERSPEAWRQVYRALSHGDAKNACKHPTINTFPRAIQDFALCFVELQAKRHKADYDPDERCFKSAVLLDIAAAELAIVDFANVPVRDRRAFAAWVLFKTR